jgi:hypothetical protein
MDTGGLAALTAALASPLACPALPLLFLLLQIIAKVQNQGCSGLKVPPPDQLPAGPLATYTAYRDLMEACWAPEPAARPHFDAIVKQLG